MWGYTTLGFFYIHAYLRCVFLCVDLTMKSSLPSSEESGDALQVDRAVAWSPPSIWLFANRKHKRCTVLSQLPTDVKIKSEPNTTCVYRGSGYMLYVRSSVLDSHKTGVYKHVKQRQQTHDPKRPMTIASFVLQWSLPSHQGSFWKAVWPFVGGSWHEKKCNWTIDLGWQHLNLVRKFFKMLKDIKYTCMSIHDWYMHALMRLNWFGLGSRSILRKNQANNGQREKLQAFTDEVVP